MCVGGVQFKKSFLISKLQRYSLLPSSLVLSLVCLHLCGWDAVMAQGFFFFFSLLSSCHESVFQQHGQTFPHWLCLSEFSELRWDHVFSERHSKRHLFDFWYHMYRQSLSLRFNFIPLVYSIMSPLVSWSYSID